MRPLSFLPVVVAAIVLAYVGHRAADPSYVPATLASDVELLPTNLSGDLPEGMVVRSFHVTGMCCEGCVGKLYYALASVDGVREAAVDFHEGTAEAVVPPELDVENLLTALRFDKYSAELAED